MLNFLEEGDIVDIVAPSSGLSLERLEKSKEFLRSWNLIPRVGTYIVTTQTNTPLLGPNSLYANTDELRFEDLERSIHETDSKAIWCIRGGCGSTKLIPKLEKMNSPSIKKLFIGFSDATSLQIFFYQKWGWLPIHGPNLSQMAEATVSANTIQTLREIIFGQLKKNEIADLVPLNTLNKACTVVDGNSVGGNLSLIQASLATSWEIETRDHIFFIEEVNERAYKVAEKLEHLKQSGKFRFCKAVIFGVFSGPQEFKKENNLILEVLQLFACSLDIPVFLSSQFGHGLTNIAIPIGTPSRLTFDKNPRIVFNLS